MANTVSIDSIRVVIEPDDSPDTSWLGEYTDTPSAWAIVRAEGEYLADLGEAYELPRRGRECRFFAPYAGGEPPGSPAYQEYGKRDFERMETLSRGDWAFVGIWTEATVSYRTGAARRIERLRSGGLWGIESDAGDYLDEVVDEQLADLLGHLEAFGVNTSNFDELAAEAKAAAF